MPPHPDALTRGRLGLIIACSDYRDPTLQQLRAPGRDAEAFADVLHDPAIGAFEVRTLLNLPSTELLRGIAEFCADSSPHDLLLIYLSCHGVLDDRGRLYYATVNTERRLLAATSVSAQWLNDQLEDCPARQQLLILDCCHSGAFAKGMKGDAALALQDRFGSRGRVVLTASRATEYSFEGSQVLGEGVSSIFTAALVQGLRTGDADRDQDGLITVTELYEHIYDRTRAADSRQTPALWTYGAEGNVLVAHSPRGAVVTPAALPEDLRATLDSPRPRVRESAVAELAELIDHAEPGLVMIAQLTLAHVAENDIPRVAGLARIALGASHGQAAEKVRAEVAERGRRDAEEQARQQAEEEARRDAEQRARQQAEEQAGREAEEEARRDAEQQARQQAEEQARREAEEEARRDAEQQARQQAEEQARREAEEEARRDAEQQARQQAEEQARQEAEQRAGQNAGEQARRDVQEAEQQARRNTEEAEGQAPQEAEEQLQPDAQRKARVLTRRRVGIAILSASLGVGIVVVLIFYLRSSPTTLSSQLPRDLRPSCTALGTNSATCALANGALAIYNLYSTADDARAFVVSRYQIAPDGDPCPPAPPTSQNHDVVCKYPSRTQRGLVRFSYISNNGSPFYQAVWSPDGKPVTGTTSSKSANREGWTTLKANWMTFASMG